jgi:hypothetical protein
VERGINGKTRFLGNDDFLTNITGTRFKAKPPQAAKKDAGNTRQEFGLFDLGEITWHRDLK